MVSNPQQWVKDYQDAGVDMFTFHLEANGIAGLLCSRESHRVNLS